MDLTTGNLEAISKIYDVTLDTNQWSGVLDELDHQVGSVGCNVFVADHTHSELTSLHVSKKLLPALEHYIANEYHKLDEALIPNLHEMIPNQDFVSVHDLYLESNLRYGTNLNSKGFEDWIEKNLGITQRFTSPLHYGAEYIDITTFQFEQLPRSKLNNALSLAKVFVPHLAKAVELTRPFSLLKSRFNSVLSVLDRFHLGVFILAPNGSIVVQNQAASRIIELSDGLLIDKKNKLFCRNTDNNAKLQTALPYVQQLSEGKKNNFSKKFTISRGGQATPYLIEISALRSLDIEMSGEFKGVIAIVIDPDYHPIIDTSGLEKLFGLTDAEQQICRLLVDGHSTNEIADTRNTSIETVRGQIKNVLFKTHTNERAGLVKLALSINLPVDTHS